MYEILIEMLNPDSVFGIVWLITDASSEESVTDKAGLLFMSGILLLVILVL